MLTSEGLPKSPKDSEVSALSGSQCSLLLIRPVDPDQAQENIAYGRALNSEVYPRYFIHEPERLRS